MPFLLLAGVIGAAWIVARVRLQRHGELQREAERRTARNLYGEAAKRLEAE